MRPAIVFIFLLVVLAAHCGGPPAVGAAELDPAFLERLEQLKKLARQAGPQLWPGWDPSATPLAIFKGTEMTVLVGHPSPPEGFRRVAVERVPAPVFVADSASGFARANTAQNFGGVLTSFFSYQDFMDKPVAAGLALAVHELFHAHYNRIAPRKYGNILIVLWGAYPAFSARNRALAAVEGELLHAAATAADEKEAREAASGFMGVRMERRKDLDPDLARYESGEETSEGLARYIEWKFLQILPALDSAYGDAAAAASARLAELQKLRAVERDRERFYISGLGVAAALDRVRPAWKQEFESGPLLLDALLAGAAPPDAGAAARGMRNAAFDRLYEDEQKVVARRLDEGTQRLVRFLGGTGERLVMEIGSLRSRTNLRGFNPNGTIPLTRDAVAHHMLLLDVGAEPGAGMRIEVRNLPLIYDRAQDTLWCVLPPATIARALEDYAKQPTGSTAPLEIKANGFYGRFTGVQIARRRRELRISPLEELKQQPDYKPPTIVRPQPPQN